MLRNTTKLLRNWPKASLLPPVGNHQVQSSINIRFGEFKTRMGFQSYFSTQTVQTPIEASETCFLTENAAKRLSLLKSKKGTESLVLRLTVQGGGCKGFEYVFETTEETPKPDDFVFETDGEKLLVDETSFELVKGSKVDFTKDLIRASFEVIDNPNAEGACGCGASFAAKMDF